MQIGMLKNIEILFKVLLDDCFSQNFLVQL
jgi:hypothetical protein